MNSEGSCSISMGDGSSVVRLFLRSSICGSSVLVVSVV